MAKYDMSTHVFILTEANLRTLVKTYHIALDLHPCLHPDLTIDHLPNDVIVLVLSGLSLAWFNPKCDMVFRRKYDNFEMSIYYFMTLPFWENAKVVEEPHEFASSMLQRVQNNTTALAAEDTPIPLPTPDEIAAGQPDLKLAKKSKAPIKRKAYTSSVGASEPDQPRRKRRLRRKALEARSSAPAVEQDEDVEGADLSDYCTFLEEAWLATPLSHVAFSDPSHVGVSNAARASSSGHADVRKGVAAIGSAGKAGAKVIRHQFDPMDVLARSALARDQEYDQIPKDNFATAFLGEEIDPPFFLLLLVLMVVKSRYTALTTSNTRLRENLKRKVGYLSELHSEISTLDKEHERVQQDWSEVAHFVGFDVDSLVRRLLSSDEFNATLSPILSLAITFGVERGLRMGRTDAEFNKVVAALPSAYFPFLAKIAEVASSSLPKVASIQPDKIVHSVVPFFVLATSLPINEAFGRTSTPKEYELPGLAPDELPGLATYVMF
ncbi:hypothetical protein Tco_0250609 [Tanacetum coccineum]